MRFAAVLAAVLLSACSDKNVEVTPAYGVPIAATHASGATSAPSGQDLILPLEVDMAAAETFIRIAYGLDKTVGFQSTLFLTPRLRTTQAERLIRMVGDYNNFNGPKVADAVLNLRGQVSGIEFGREGSPVIYIELPYWTHQREETSLPGQGTRIPESEINKMASEIRELFVTQLGADEFSIDRRRVRIWWD
jgi:hypothetical protein